MAISRGMLFLYADPISIFLGKSDPVDELTSPYEPAVKRGDGRFADEAQLGGAAQLAALAAPRCGLWSEQAPAQPPIAKSAER
jgi:hypothetical protein